VTARQSLAPLFSTDPTRRLDALDAVDSSAPARYALRSLLASDSDARVRARAAAKLGRAGSPAFAGDLLEAAQVDRFPLVREAAWRALARRGGSAGVFAGARLAATAEPIWWVRTAAVAAITACADRGPLERAAALRRTLDDPFWRVRFAAVGALQTLGEAEPAVWRWLLGTDCRSETEASAVEYLRRRWAGDESGELEPALLVEPPADPLWDPDPAVVTTRLESPDAKPSLALLIELCADPHEPLRKLAIRRLAARRDPRALRAALCWLEDPRVPRGPAAVVSMLDRMSELAAEVAADVLADPPGAGALVWALRWAGATRSAELAAEVTAALEDMEPAVREAAIGALAGLGVAADWVDRLVALAAADPDPSVRSEATAVAALASGPALLDAIVPAAAPPRQRRELARIAARARRFDWLGAAAADADAETRATAIAALVAAGELDAASIAAALDDEDPWIRAAALGGDLDRAAELARSDFDPQVRRRALETLGRARVAVGAELIEAVYGDADPGLRHRLAALLDPGRPGDLRALLALSFDRAAEVRAAAADSLSRASSDAVRALLETEADEQIRKAAHTVLARDLDDEAAAALVAAHAKETPAVRAHLEAIALTMPESAAPLLADLPVPARRPRRSRPVLAPQQREVERRPLGATGLEVAPLALSGAKDLITRAFDRGFEGGVNLFFWEPRYLTLGRFLKRKPMRDRAHVIAGTYHATPDAIEADVDTALRRLRRDRIDVFLIFWVRSAERLGDPVFERLARLKESGKIGCAGFSTHHRDLAESAIAARPWDVVMTRHSAAHPGAERSLLAAARARGVGVLGFSALCYGRLLQPSSRHPAPSAPDCYRYSLSQPIDAVISAPSRYRELIENLAVLERPTLEPDAIAALRCHGTWVHAQSADFGALVRRTPRQYSTTSPTLTTEETIDRR
jgi:HEAT repeat protein